VGAIFYRGRANGTARLLVNDPDILAYRSKWLEAAFAPTPVGQNVSALVHFHEALNPTADKPQGPIARQGLLQNWNRALQSLHLLIQYPDVTMPLVDYGSDFTAAELPEIPSRDFPMGLPSWARSSDFWANMSNPPGDERANISIEVP